MTASWQKLPREHKKNQRIEKDANRPGNGYAIDSVVPAHVPECDQICRQFEQMQLCGKVGSANALHERKRNLRQTIDEHPRRQPFEDARTVCGKVGPNPKPEAVS